MTRMVSLSRQTRVTVYIATLSLVGLMSPDAGQAQTTNITSSGLGTTVGAPTTLPNGMINHDITGGTRPGNGPNLFHSFGEFSVPTNNIANFLNETATPTTNILSRVTGGNPSNIFGTLQTTDFGAANLYLINPAGVVFGPTAELNVGGSVNISTADYLRLADGMRFNTLPGPTDALLSIAPVAAFGFVGGTPTLAAQTGRVTLNGGTVLGGQTLSVVGRDNLVNGVRNPGIEMTGGTLSNAGGRVNFVSVDQPVVLDTGGEVQVSGEGHTLSLMPHNFSSLGEIRLSGGVTINTSGNAAGPVVLRGGKVVMEQAGLRADTINEAGGEINITGTTVDLKDGTIIKADTTGAAPAGDITLNVGTLTATNSTISSGSDFIDSTAGNAGSITIQGITPGSPATSVSFDGITSIRTEIVGGNQDTQPGAITITAHTITARTLDLANDAVQLQSDTAGPAPAGDITLNVDTLTAINSTGNPNPITISSESVSTDSTAGKAGSIKIQGITTPGSPATPATNVSFDGGAVFSTRVLGGSKDTPPGTITISARTLVLDATNIEADTTGAAPAGDITLNVGTLTADTSEISSSSTFADPTAGNAGTISIQGLTGAGSAATNVSFDNSTISTTIAGGSSASLASTIGITAQEINLTNGAQVLATTSGAAPAGNISVHVDTFRSNVDEAGLPIEGSIADEVMISSKSFDQTEEGGAPGSITISGVASGIEDPASLVVLDNTTINTDVFGGRDMTVPGSITMTAKTIQLGFESSTGSTRISSQTGGNANAGSISFNVDEMKTDGNLTAGVFIDTNALSDSGTGATGAIRIQGLSGPDSSASSVSLIATFLDSLSGRATTRTQGSGEISIRAKSLELLFSSLESTTRGSANAGNITLNVDRLKGEVAGIISNGEGSFTGVRDNEFVRIFIDDPGSAGRIRIQGLNGDGSPASKVEFTSSNIESEQRDGTSQKGGDIEIIAKTLDFPPDPSGIVFFNGREIATSVVNISTEAFGRSASAGNIRFNVETFTDHGSFISSTSRTSGPAGSIRIQGINGDGSAASQVSLTFTTLAAEQTGPSQGGGGNIAITSKNLNLIDFAEISALSTRTGNAGDITLNVEHLRSNVDENGTPLSGVEPVIISSSSTSSSATAGRAGNVTIRGVGGEGTVAQTIVLNNTRVTTEADAGAGGLISLAASGPLTLTNATLSATVSGGTNVTHPPANVQLRAGSLAMSGGVIAAETGGASTGGKIDVNVGNLALANGAKISTSSTSEAPTAGLAGNIKLTSATDLLMRNSTVSTSATQASGGNIKLKAPNLIRIVDSKLTSSVLAQSDGGNIDIDPQLVVIQNSQILANADKGAGGKITINASGAVLVDPNTRINASAGPAGISGTVNINAPIQVLSGTLVPLKLAYSQAGLSGDRCAADPQGQFSSFVQTGRDGVPQVPGALSPSPLSFLETLTSGSFGSPWPNLAAARLGLDSVSFDDSTLFRFHSACRS